MPHLAVALLLALTTPAAADEVRAAVAANFTAPMKEVAAGFERASGHRVSLSFASTGKLYAQVKNGAPFEVLLAADAKTPALLVEEGLASRLFTYAIGRLVLWSADSTLVDPAGKVLRTGDFRRLAIANPKTAPYGAAAIEVLEALGLSDTLSSKLVQGDNIAQTFQFVVSRNADLGFIASSQLALEPDGSSWQVPEELHTPIRQDAVLLHKGQDSAAAKALLDYLQGDDARGVIERFGYGLEPLKQSRGDRRAIAVTPSAGGGVLRVRVSGRDGPRGSRHHPDA
jgi:molybdate transport system substrate-binding protein